ncbi:Spx domain-containing protein [Thalictrum thalictroides]|uniref:Spx domain-containing protein n=1 Tax=Thalictrum thalictroides TaxID=46969 RepID=A0A7J6WVW3_THATH|nr:Spx domain-containing protein [Thalictrum thalictroides]
MKFGKSLSNQIEETLPSWRDKFLSYKELKKRLKLIDSKQKKDYGEVDEERSRKRLRLSSSDGENEEEEENKEIITRDEIDFIRFIEAEIDKFNNFFVDKEEGYIIKLKDLQDRLANTKKPCEELLAVLKEIVDFHGEMVLLENYSALNYTGLVKILKKYEKRTGDLIRLPFIQKILQQPFYSTDVLFKLVKECQVMLDHLFPTNDPSIRVVVANDDEGGTSEPIGVNKDGVGVVVANDDEGVASEPIGVNKDGVLRMPKELEDIEQMESLYFKGTVSALRVLTEIRSGSSTVSMFSLPPLKTSSVEETWNKVPVLEQEAK